MYLVSVLHSLQLENACFCASQPVKILAFRQTYFSSLLYSCCTYLPATLRDSNPQRFDRNAVQW